MDGPLRRVISARPGNDRPAKDPTKPFEAFYTGAWWLTLTCGHIRVIPRVGFESPLTARCEPTCSVRRRLYGGHMTPHGLLKDKRVLLVENLGPAPSVLEDS